MVDVVTIHKHTSPHANTAHPVFFAVLAALIMAITLGVGTSLGKLVASPLPDAGFLARLIPAMLVTTIAIGGVWALLLRKGSLSLEKSGIRTPDGIMKPALTGVLVASLAASLVILPAVLLGWIQLDLTSGSQLLYFLLTNLIIGLLLEAIPEELTLRGWTYGSLLQRFNKIRSGLYTTALFMVVPGLSTVVSAGFNVLTGQAAGHIGIAPQGEDPISYLILLAVFGGTLIAARTALSARPVWTSVGFHITFLTVNRLFFADGRQTGLVADRVSADVVLLVPVYLLLAWIGFKLIAKRSRKHESLGAASL